MDFESLPVEIILMIAFCRPGAFAVMIRLNWYFRGILEGESINARRRFYKLERKRRHIMGIECILNQYRQPCGRLDGMAIGETFYGHWVSMKYVNGLKHGSFVIRGDRRSKLKIRYRNGLKQGRMIITDGEGRIVFSIMYDNDIAIMLGAWGSYIGTDTYRTFRGYINETSLRRELPRMLAIAGIKLG